MSLRFGLIGCGEIGKLRAAALSESAMRLTAVCDADNTRAESLGRQHQAVIEADWRALIARNDIDAILVSTPPSLHAEMAIEALRAGKHVLCEKPLARSAEECRRMLGAEAESGRKLATGFNYRFYPSIAKARALLDSGIIGTLDHIRGYTGYSATAHHQAWLHDHAVMGGGSLRDNGIHLIDTVCYFLGDVAEMQGAASGHVWKFPGCEDNGFALLRNKAGNIACLQASWTEWRGYRFEIHVYGTRGMIRASCFPMFTQVVWGERLGGKTQRKSWFFWKTHLMEHLRSYRWVVMQSFLQEFAEFGRLVRGEPSAIATGHDGLRSVEIAESAALPSQENVHVVAH